MVDAVTRTGGQFLHECPGAKSLPVVRLFVPLALLAIDLPVFHSSHRMGMSWRILGSHGEQLCHRRDVGGRDESQWLFTRSPGLRHDYGGGRFTLTVTGK